MPERLVRRRSTSTHNEADVSTDDEDDRPVSSKAAALPTTPTAAVSGALPVSRNSSGSQYSKSNSAVGAAESKTPASGKKASVVGAVAASISSATGVSASARRNRNDDHDDDDHPAGPPPKLPDMGEADHPAIVTKELRTGSPAPAPAHVSTPERKRMSPEPTQTPDFVGAKQRSASPVSNAAPVMSSAPPADVDRTAATSPKLKFEWTPQHKNSDAAPPSFALDTPDAKWSKFRGPASESRPARRSAKTDPYDSGDASDPELRGAPSMSGSQRSQTGYAKARPLDVNPPPSFGQTRGSNMAGTPSGAAGGHTRQARSHSPSAGAGLLAASISASLNPHQRSVSPHSHGGGAGATGSVKGHSQSVVVPKTTSLPDYRAVKPRYMDSPADQKRPSAAPSAAAAVPKLDLKRMSHPDRNGKTLSSESLESMGSMPDASGYPQTSVGRAAGAAYRSPQSSVKTAAASKRDRVCKGVSSLLSSSSRSSSKCLG